jgi:hypothetical protein
MIITFLKIYVVLGLFSFLYLSNKYRNFLRLDTVFLILSKSVVIWPKLLYDDYKIEKDIETNKKNKVILFKNKSREEKKDQ